MRFSTIFLWSEFVLFKLHQDKNVYLWRDTEFSILAIYIELCRNENPLSSLRRGNISPDPQGLHGTWADHRATYTELRDGALQIFELWCHIHFSSSDDEIFSKQQIFWLQVASKVPIRPCSAALPSGTLAPLHGLHTWANYKWKHRPDRRLCQLRRTGFQSECRGVSCFLRAIFFNRVSKVNIPTNLQLSQFRSRRYRENVKEWRKWIFLF